jgi:hypothetical protein
MDPSWNRGGATADKRSARQRPQDGFNYRDGKEGVSGSSPEEGLYKSPQARGFSFKRDWTSASLLGYGTDLGTAKRKRPIDSSQSHTIQAMGDDRRREVSAAKVCA